jgi:predicted alpha/beta hydrolase
MEIPVRADDGHRFAVRLVPGDAGAPGLLFLPALGVPAEKYDRFATALAARGIGVAVPDWRGIGTSDRRAARGSDWGYPDLIQRDLPAVRAALARHPARAWAIGGHSLGGQIAAMVAALSPADYSALVLVATGVPDARTFSGARRLGVRLFAGAIPWLTRAFGYFPGQRLRWAGLEAATLMRHWAATVPRGDYDAVGIAGMEARLRALDLPAIGVRFTHDTLAPEASLAALLGKLGTGERALEVFDHARLGDTPDHFRWLKSPAAPADCIADWLRVSP